YSSNWTTGRATGLLTVTAGGGASARGGAFSPQPTSTRAASRKTPAKRRTGSWVFMAVALGTRGRSGREGVPSSNPFGRGRHGVSARWGGAPQGQRQQHPGGAGGQEVDADEQADDPHGGLRPFPPDQHPHEQRDYAVAQHPAPAG